jgi:hypothetical protein
MDPHLSEVVEAGSMKARVAGSGCPVSATLGHDRWHHLQAKIMAARCNFCSRFLRHSSYRYRRWCAVHAGAARCRLKRASMGIAICEALA